MTKTDYLYAKPSFLGGMARVLDLGGTLKEYNSSSSSEEADARAISSDWKMVGKDIKAAMLRHDEEEKK
ncbi:MAG TPA: hypothetical protein PKH33_16160 [bacterium]|nr:hypothetical protein [bacterium]